MENSSEGRFFFHFQQYLLFASSSLLQNNVQRPGAAGRRGTPGVKCCSRLCTPSLAPNPEAGA